MTTGAKTGAKGLKSKTVLKIHWKSSSEYLTMEESAEPEATSEVKIGATAGVKVYVAEEAGVQWLLPLVEVRPASLSLPL